MVTLSFCVTSYALYTTSQPIIVSSLYCTYDITTSIYESTFSMSCNIYTTHETSQPLTVSSHTLYRQYHMHSWYDITLAIYVALFPLCKTSDPHFTTSNHRIYVITATIFDNLSTVSVSSHPLYWWYHINCISVITSAKVHNIIYIVYDMTHTVWHRNHCFHGIRFPTYHITSRIYDMSSPIAVTSQTLCLWIYVTIFNIKHMVLR